MSRFPNRKWVIITLSDYNESQLQEFVDNALEPSIDTLLNLKETKAILKWEGETPSVFNNMTSYNHQEILTILKGSEWTEA
tara:strand:- start:5437 stop:5679 length:243 start_codon:yes stop_codon:yes gene_type:complete